MDDPDDWESVKLEYTSLYATYKTSKISTGYTQCSRRELIDQCDFIICDTASEDALTDDIKNTCKKLTV